MPRGRARWRAPQNVGVENSRYSMESRPPDSECQVPMRGTRVTDAVAPHVSQIGSVKNTGNLQIGIIIA